MAGASLLTLLDDIAAVLDDVALMTKVAAKKTAGVLGDDLALNAEQVSGVRAERELPVVWAVAKGSFRNKLILVPAAIAISASFFWLVGTSARIFAASRAARPSVSISSRLVIISVMCGLRPSAPCRRGGSARRARGSPAPSRSRRT